MASISRALFLRHLRAEPNQFILHYRDGKPIRRGAGIAYWFYPLSAAVAQVPVEDCETTFVFKERSLDFQDVTVQCTVTYRFTDAERAAARVNFSISLQTGAWIEQPLERLANLWNQKSQQPARTFIATTEIVEILRTGADRIRGAIDAVLRADSELAAMGVSVVNVLVTQISPTAELEKALQTPAREAMQQKADEAVFARRALAVEKERAIKENELATQIELAKREDQLIRQKGANRLLEVQTTAEAERQRVEADWQRDRIAADAYAQNILTRAGGDVEVRRRNAAVDLEAEERRIGLWRDAPASVAAGLAAQQLASKIQSIQHLNLTPELLTTVFQQFLRNEASR